MVYYGPNNTIGYNYSIFSESFGESFSDIIWRAEYKIAREIWKKAGYGLTEVVLNASYYDVPQARKRFSVLE